MQSDELVRRRGNAYVVSAPTSPAVVEFNPWLESQPRSSSGQLELNIFGVRRLCEYLEQSKGELNQADGLLLEQVRPHVRRFQRSERQAFHILSQRRPREERRGKPLQAIRPLRMRPARSRESSPRRNVRTTASATRDGPLADEDDPEPPELVRPRLSRAERDFLHSEIDRRRRVQLVTERDHLRLVPAGGWLA